MKKFLKPVILSAITMFSISCSSSDDNSNLGKEDDNNYATLTVLDKTTSNSYLNINTSADLSKQTFAKYNYDLSGKVISIDITGFNDINLGGQGDPVNENIAYKYNANNTISEITHTDNIDNEIENHSIYEYNDKKQVTKITNKENDIFTIITTYKYTDNNITSVIHSRGTDEIKANYTYLNNAPVKVNIMYTTGSQHNEEITYDDKLNAFINMNIGFDYLPSSSLELFPQNFAFKNNIKLVKYNDNDATEIVYEYDPKSNLPIKSTVYSITKNKNKIADYTYTYKTIKVKK